MTLAFPKPGPKMRKPGWMERDHKRDERDRKAGRWSSLPSRRTKQRRSDRRRDPVYLAKVRRLPCAIRKWPGHSCEGRIEADHQGPRPLGRKCHDDEAVPMCQKAHWQRTNYVGVFAGFTAPEMRAECDVLIATTRRQLNWTPPKETP